MNWDNFFGIKTSIFHSNKKKNNELKALFFLLVASLGGIFGLCLGASIISFIEVIYFFVARIFFKCLTKQTSTRSGTISQTPSEGLQNDEPSPNKQEINRGGPFVSYQYIH